MHKKDTFRKHVCFGCGKRLGKGLMQLGLEKMEMDEMKIRADIRFWDKKLMIDMWRKVGG